MGIQGRKEFVYFYFYACFCTYCFMIGSMWNVYISKRRNELMIPIQKDMDNLGLLSFFLLSTAFWFLIPTNGPNVASF